MQPPRRPVWIAHRGASAECPENTLAAVRRAIELGAPMIEVDCRLTRDGAVVLLHDDTLERTTNGRGRVEELSLREVRALDAGSWFGRAFRGEPVPTLEELLECVGDAAALNLELKGDADPGRLELAVLGIVASYGFLPRVVFSSFSRRRMRALRERSARARIGILLDAGDRWEEGLDLAAELGAEALHPEISLVRPRRVAQAHARGLEVRVWPVSRKREIERLSAWGVDALFCDFDPFR
jgi:glycerophosphoryl diester phosphodiesterase